MDFWTHVLFCPGLGMSELFRLEGKEIKNALHVWCVF